MSKRRKQVDSLFSKWDCQDSPGCALGVIQDEKLIYTRGYGMANLEHKVPITSNSVFRTGSVSKQFTAMCIAILAQKGKLSLDDSVRKVIPELPKYADPVSIRHMIHHSSGIRSYTSLFVLSMLSQDVRDADIITKKDSLDMVARQKALDFNPGERFEYNNSNYFLLGVIVERVSGKSLRDFADDIIFRPLGMSNTHYHDDCKMVVPNRAYGYAPKEKGGFEVSMSNCEVVGDGCVFSSVNDLLLWDSNFYNNKLAGGKKLVKMIETSGFLNSGEENLYAFGLSKSVHKGLPLISHGGAWAGFRAYMARFPEQKFSVIVLGNLSTLPVQKLGLQVADLYLESFFDEEYKLKQSELTKPSVAVKLPKKSLENLVGLYLTSVGSLVEVSREESNLSMVLSGWKESRTTYVPVSKTSLHPLEGVLTGRIDVERDEGKKSLRLIYHRPDNTTSTWKPIPKVLSAKEKSDYIGHYYSLELDTTYQITTSEDGSLICRTYPRLSEDYETHKICKDEVILMGIQLKFRRNKQGTVTGFDLSAPGGVSNVSFRKKK